MHSAHGQPFVTSPTPRTATRRARRAARGGFTLIEASMVTAIIGLGVMAMLELLAAGSVSNAYGTEMTTAVNLARNVHEISLGLPFYDPQEPTKWDTKEAGGVTAWDDLLDLDGASFSPPLDVRKQPMPLYEGWTQKVSVETVAHDFVGSVRPDTTTEPTAQVTVVVMHHGKEIYKLSWLAVAPSPE
jgi:hypothetical protein